MADVASDGPFSAFPGIDRTLIVVEGDGIELDVEGIAYPLDEAVSQAVVFRRRHHDRAAPLGADPRSQRHDPARAVPAPDAVRANRAWRCWPRRPCAAFIVALDGPFDVTLDATIHSLQVLDTLMLEATQDLIQLSGTGRAILVEIAPEASA